MKTIINIVVFCLCLAVASATDGQRGGNLRSVRHLDAAAAQQQEDGNEAARLLEGSPSTINGVPATPEQAEFMEELEVQTRKKDNKKKDKGNNSGGNNESADGRHNAGGLMGSPFVGGTPCTMPTGFNCPMGSIAKLVPLDCEWKCMGGNGNGGGNNGKDNKKKSGKRLR